MSHDFLGHGHTDELRGPDAQIRGERAHLAFDRRVNTTRNDRLFTRLGATRSAGYDYRFPSHGAKFGSTAGRYPVTETDFISLPCSCYEMLLHAVAPQELSARAGRARVRGRLAAQLGWRGTDGRTGETRGRGARARRLGSLVDERRIRDQSILGMLALVERWLRHLDHLGSAHARSEHLAFVRLHGSVERDRLARLNGLRRAAAAVECRCNQLRRRPDWRSSTARIALAALWGLEEESLSKRLLRTRRQTKPVSRITLPVGA